MWWEWASLFLFTPILIRSNKVCTVDLVFFTSFWIHPYKVCKFLLSENCHYILTRHLVILWIAVMLETISIVFLVATSLIPQSCEADLNSTPKWDIYDLLDSLSLDFWNLPILCTCCLMIHKVRNDVPYCWVLKNTSASGTEWPPSPLHQNLIFLF